MDKPKTANVLVVDDEADIRRLLIDALSSDQLHVRAASTGREAIDLAKAHRPDILVTDLLLGDCTGLDVIDRLRKVSGDVPAVVISGKGTPAAFSEASRRRPVQLLTKPIDLPRLRSVISEELTRRDRLRQLRDRTRRLRGLAKSVNRERKDARRQLDTTCVDLTAAYRSLSGRLALQQGVLAYQGELIAAKNDDDVFRALFKLFVRKSGPLYGVALVCDNEARLRIIGRFGVPKPDGIRFCQAISRPAIDSLLTNPACALIDAEQKADSFDKSIRKYLIGLTILAIPLIPTPGEMIGLAALYRKGEQPFTDDDLAVAEMIVTPTAVAVRRND